MSAILTLAVFGGWLLGILTSEVAAKLREQRRTSARAALAASRSTEGRS